MAQPALEKVSTEVRLAMLAPVLPDGIFPNPTAGPLSLSQNTAVTAPLVLLDTPFVAPSGRLYTLLIDVLFQPRIPAWLLELPAKETCEYESVIDVWEESK
jgi:hypothetical protein